MYRDDRCPMCGDALPPDHLYCRMHAAEVDRTLWEIGDRLKAMSHDAADLADLLERIAPETWDYLAESQPDDPEWPPSVDIQLRLRPEDVDVDVDTEPGLVRIRLEMRLAGLLAGVADSLRSTVSSPFHAALMHAQGAGATH